MNFFVNFLKRNFLLGHPVQSSKNYLLITGTSCLKLIHASYLSTVHCIVHNIHPALKYCHFKEGKVRCTHVVKAHHTVLPREVHLKTRIHVWDQLCIRHFSVFINALITKQNKMWKINDAFIYKIKRRKTMGESRIYTRSWTLILLLFCLSSASRPQKVHPLG